MSVFGIEKAQAKITSVTNRAELHGAESVPAMTLYLTLMAPANTADPLDANLRKLFFRKPGKEETVQGELPGTNSNDGNTALRFPKVKSHLWEEKFTGYALVIGSGLQETGGITVDMVNIKHLLLTPREGGVIEYKIPCAFVVDEHLAGKMAMLNGQTVEVSIAPRSDAQQALAA